MSAFYEKSQFFSPFNLEQIETAHKNAKNYASLLAADSAALTAFCVAFQGNANLNYADLLAVDDAMSRASIIAIQAYTNLTDFICDIRSPSGFLMSREELVMGLDLTREWLDMTSRRREFGGLKDMIQTVISKTMG